jgi:hypothetical protein
MTTVDVVELNFAALGESESLGCSLMRLDLSHNNFRFPMTFCIWAGFSVSVIVENLP